MFHRWVTTKPTKEHFNSIVYSFLKEHNESNMINQISLIIKILKLHFRSAKRFHLEFLKLNEHRMHLWLYLINEYGEV